ncbi:hypothetical protein V2J09_018104 [Rumex salicifolius]
MGVAHLSTYRAISVSSSHFHIFFPFSTLEFLEFQNPRLPSQNTQFQARKMPSEDSKTLKKEELEEEDEDEKCLSSIIRDKSKKKPLSSSNAASSKLPKPKKEETLGANGNSSQKKPISKPVKVKKLEPTSDSDDDKPISKKPVAKDDKVKNKKKEVKKTNGVDTNKRERKVYDLPGQKRDPPEERDPLRIFYESLYEQRNDSEMAAICCAVEPMIKFSSAKFYLPGMMESGLLPEDVAKKVYERKQKKSQMQRLGSPMKVMSKSVTVKKVKDPSSNSANKTNTTKTVTTVKTKKRKKDESSEDEDLDDDFVISTVTKKRKA